MITALNHVLISLSRCDVTESRVADRVRSQPLEAFLAEQVLEWNDYCKALFADGVGIAYPYTLADMQQWEDALLLSLRLQKEGHGGSSSTSTQGDRRQEGGSSRCEREGSDERGTPLNLLV